MTKTELKEMREALHRAIEMVVIGDITSQEFRAILNGVNTLFQIDAAITKHGTKRD